MGKRGPKPKGKVGIVWSPAFAYAIGLLVTDGNLSPSGRHINLTSKDLELIQTFQEALGITGHIGKKSSGHGGGEKKYYVVQFGDVLFYDFLLSIGLTPNKTKTIGAVDIPKEYFFHFLRGHFDGDGCTYSYWDSRWEHSFMFYLGFASASLAHLQWLRLMIASLLPVRGHITHNKEGTYHQLKYAKREGIQVIRKMYESPNALCLERKRLKIEQMLSIVGEHLLKG